MSLTLVLCEFLQVYIIIYESLEISSQLHISQKQNTIYSIYGKQVYTCQIYITSTIVYHNGVNSLRISLSATTQMCSVKFCTINCILPVPVYKSLTVTGHRVNTQPNSQQISSNYTSIRNDVNVRKTVKRNGNTFQE